MATHVPSVSVGRASVSAHTPEKRCEHDERVLVANPHGDGTAFGVGRQIRPKPAGGEKVGFAVVCFAVLSWDLHATLVRFARARGSFIAADIGDLVKNDDERLRY